MSNNADAVPKKGEKTHVAVTVAEGNRTVAIDPSSNTVPIGIQLADDFDRELLHRAVADAGLWAFGAVMVEVWVMNQTQSKLFRPKVGWWVDPVVLTRQPQLQIFTDTNHPDYLEPLPLSPGVGLPGILWTEVTAREIGNRPASRRFMLAPMAPRRKVAWRDVEYLSKDPDQPFNRRLQGLADAGLGWAAGIPFDIGGKQGIVVYMCLKTIDLERVKTPTNESYLISAADLIGSAWSLRAPRHEAVEIRKKERRELLRRVRSKMLAVVRAGQFSRLHDLYDDHDAAAAAASAAAAAATLALAAVETPEPEKQGETKHGFELHIVETIQSKARQVFVKTFHKPTSQMPPFKSTSAALYDGFGALLTMLIITQLSEHMTETYSSEWSIVVGPFAALATSHYALTSAPASQPINCILGQSMGITIAILLTYSNLELYLRQSFGCALTVFLMSRFSLIHPPAASITIIFASGTLDWSEMAAFLMGYVIIILVSTFMNNINTYRQYPAYWGFEPLLEWVEQQRAMKKEKGESSGE